MNLLEESRLQIDEADIQIAKLFEQRFHAVRNVLEYKREHGMQILDSSREKAIMEKNSQRLEDRSLEPYFRDFYQHMMDVSKKYQKDLLEENEKIQ